MIFYWGIVFIIIVIILIILIIIISTRIYKNLYGQYNFILEEQFTTDIYNNDKELTTSEVIDEKSYEHFKQLISKSKKLCYGRTHNNMPYKVRVALSKDYKTLLTKDHYKILYIHTKTEIIAYIAVKLYKKDGGFMFIHKLCSTGEGYGTTLMNTILKEARNKHIELGITYLSLTTHNLDLIDYYKTFNPTRTEIINNPGSKRKIPKKVAYMIWQLSPNMPELNYS